MKSRPVYLLLGSNLGNRKKNIARARKLIESEIGKIYEASALYETAAWGVDEPQDSYLNQALKLQSQRSGEELMQIFLDIETQMGRIRTKPAAPRIIDIDILLIGNEIINTPTLKIPHPRLHLRNFALIPLLEIGGNREHPELKQTIEDIYFSCEDRLEVIKIDG